jgi:hypothetical protein
MNLCTWHMQSAHAVVVCVRARLLVFGSVPQCLYRCRRMCAGLRAQACCYS